MTEELQVTKTVTNWLTSPASVTTENFVIDAPTINEAYATFFREFENRYRYCNNTRFTLRCEAHQSAYRDWISNIDNYMSAGGRMD